MRVVLTPRELDSAERAINANLLHVDTVTGGPRRRVCLHPDRTRTVSPAGVVRVECDYCDTWSAALDREPVDLMPWLYLDPTRSTL